MNDVLKVDIASEADIFIMEYKLKKFMQKYHLDLPSVLLVARELATNILKYGGKGFVEIRLKIDKVVILVEDIGKDSGNNLEQEIKRGLGVGLEIVRDNSDELKVEHKEDGGTSIRAVFLFSRNKKRDFILQFGTASRPHYLEEESGDICLYKEMDGKYFLLVADVLGHGSGASEVAKLIEHYVKGSKEEYIEEIYAGLERVIKGTRGCAVFAAFISKYRIEYFNIGNIRGWILFPDSVKKLKEIPGVVGRMPVKVKVFEEPVSLLCSTLLVCTDGIKRQFIPTPEMEWIITLNPRDVAEKIMEDFSIKEDDATVMIARGGTSPWKTCSAL